MIRRFRIIIALLVGISLLSCNNRSDNQNDSRKGLFQYAKNIYSNFNGDSVTIYFPWNNSRDSIVYQLRQIQAERIAVLSTTDIAMLAEMGYIYLVSTITDEEVYNVMSALLDAGALYYKHSAPLTETYVNDPEALVNIQAGVEYIACGFPFNANDELGTFTSPIHFIPGTGIISGGENGSSLSEVSMLQMEVYPNPAKDFVTLSADSKISSVEIFNTLGQKVFSVENGLTNMITINTTSFDRGVFVAKVKTEKGVTSTKLVIE